MVERILDWSLKNRFLVMVLAGLVVVGGLFAISRLPIDAVPDVTNVQVQILTSAPALGPEEIERFITTPIELEMNGLPGLTELRSQSRFGLSAVTVVFEDGTDIYFARQLVSERLQAARESIPPGYGDPQLGPISTGLGEIYQFEVRGPGKTPTELRTILDWEITPRLRAVPGVVEINAMGGELKTYEVQVHPDRLASYHLSVTDLFAALDRNNANAGGAYIVKNDEQVPLRGEGLIPPLDDIGNIVLTTDAAGTPVYIRHVADVVFAPMVRQGAVTRDGQGEIVSGTVMMLMGASSLRVVDDVKAAIAALGPALAKLGVSIEPWYDRTELVDKTIGTVTRNLVEGGVLVIVVLLLMLRSLRAGLIVGTAIPLSMLVVFIGMNAFHVPGNLMSLGAIDFGLIVDGAVIVVESSVRTLAEQSHVLGRPVTAMERSAVVRTASREVLRSATFGVTIIAIVYLPVLTLTGIEGKMFRPMALTVLFALAASLVLAMTLMPALASLCLPRRLTERESFIVAGARKLYAPLLRGSIRRRWITVVIAVGVLGASVFTATSLGAEFVPRLDEGAIALDARQLPSVSLDQALRQTSAIERVLLRFPEVVRVVSKAGRAEIATDPQGVDVADLTVILKPAALWTTAETSEGLVAAFATALRHDIGGVTYSFSQPIEMRVSELISGTRSDVALAIYGDDLAALQRLAAAATQVLAKVPGAADVRAEQTAGLPVLRVRVDRRAIARHGINAGDVLDVITTLGGRAAGVVLEGDRRFALQVRFAPNARADADAIANLKVRSPRGALIPLSELATIRIEDGPAQISHQAAHRRIVVEANVRGRDLAGFVADAQAAMRDADVIPAGYFVEWGGQFKNLQEATLRLAIVVPIALLLIFVLLFVSTGSARLAVLIYVNVPFAVTGGIFALAVRGMPLSISAGVGFVALFGVAVLNGLVLVSAIDRRRADGTDPSAAAFAGAALRLRPVLMTALVASLGFVPMAIAHGAGAEVQKPLATVVIGGIVTSTLLTLLVLPTVYAWWFGRGRATPTQ